MTSTAKQMLPAIGAGVEVRFESILVNCTVRDVKNSYGRVRLLVEPMCGSGVQWIETNRIASKLAVSHDGFHKRLEDKQ